MKFAAVVIMLFLATLARAQNFVTHVDDPKILADVERAGFGIADAFGAPGAADLKALALDSEPWRDFAATISRDISALRTEMAAGGRKLLEVTDDNIGRIMDPRWLTSEAAHMRLVGVVNRMDKADFHTVSGELDCGEARLLYRLAYDFRARGKRFASRMPFSINVVYTVKPDPDGSCAAAALVWKPGVEDVADAGWLTGGPLAKDRLALRQIEVNAQIVRLPAGLETTFGGQAAYVLRVFTLENGKLAPKPLENTPDAARISTDPALKRELAAFVAAEALAIDGGVFELPAAFLAEKAVSWSTFGSIRAGNRPFAGLLSEADLAAVDFSGLPHFKDAKGLIARLDNSTCQGCHQAGAIAGFHFIGRDDATASPLNRIAVGMSPHFVAERERRQMWLAAVSGGFQPNAYRPLSAAPPADWSSGDPDFARAAAGQPCSLDGKGYAERWFCAAGLECRAIAKAAEGPEMGQCLLPLGSTKMYSGQACLSGTVATKPGRPFNDRFKIDGQFAAFAPSISRDTFTCRPPEIGVPGGLAYRACTQADRDFAAFKPGKPAPDEICGLVGGKAFDKCAASNAFDECLSAATVRGNRQTCSAFLPCREDYMCQDFPPDTPKLARVKGFGFCSPTYFVFQMRIDNHPTPW